MNRIIPHALFACAALFLASCNDVAAPTTLNKPSFASQMHYDLSVARVDVVEDYVSPFKEPNVEHLFPTPPAEGVKIWAQDRLRAVGRENRLEVVIKDASVVETKLPKTQGVKGMFTVDQGEQYDAKLDVEIKIYGTRSALPEAGTSVSVSKSRTIAEDASVAQRDALFNQMTLEMMDMFNTEMDRQIRSYLGSYLAN